MRFKLFISLLVLTIFSNACTEKDNSEELFGEVLENYAGIVSVNYKETYQGVVNLEAAIKTLTTEPSEEALEDAKEAWLKARESYGKTEAFRFYGGPIDDEDGPEGQMNAWPLDEAYIDYVNNPEADNANIINSVEVFPEITSELIASLNENGSETNVSIGYHAIEFLLWGQDLSDGPGGGERPYTDYVVGEKGTAKNQERRGLYLMAAAELLVADLGGLVEAWDVNKENFRRKFMTTPQKSIEDIIAGLGRLSKGELAGERMFVAYDLQSKEDEHSCFSDNTHNDIVNNAEGIQNVFLGTFTTQNGKTLAGKSVYEVLKRQDAELAEDIKQLINESVEACKAIQPPFDQEIKSTEGRVRISKAIGLLRKQGDKLAEAATIFAQRNTAESL